MRPWVVWCCSAAVLQVARLVPPLLVASARRVVQRGLMSRPLTIETNARTRANGRKPSRGRAARGRGQSCLRGRLLPRATHRPPQPVRDSQSRGGGKGAHSGQAAALWADLLRKSPRSGKQGLVRHEQAEPRHSFPREAGRQVRVRRLSLSSDFPCLRADKSAVQRGLGESRPAILVRGRLCSLF